MPTLQFCIQQPAVLFTRHLAVLIWSTVPSTNITWDNQSLWRYFAKVQPLVLSGLLPTNSWLKTDLFWHKNRSSSLKIVEVIFIWKSRTLPVSVTLRSKSTTSCAVGTSTNELKTDLFWHKNHSSSSKIVKVIFICKSTTLPVKVTLFCKSTTLY